MKKKNILLSAIVIIIAFTGILFFSQSSTHNSETFLTAEGKWIVDTNSSSDQRIADYQKIEQIILDTDYNKKISIKKSIDKLLIYSQQYNLNDTQRRIENIQNNVDVVNSSDISKHSFYNLIPDFAKCLVGNVYAEKYECRYTLPIDSNKYIELMNTLGYSSEKIDTTSETYYQFKKNDDNTGSIYMDPKGNVTSVLVSIDISPYTAGYATSTYNAYTEDKRVAADASNAMSYISNLSDKTLTSDARLNFLCSNNEIIQIYQVLKNLSYGEVTTLFSETPSLYFLQTENHVISVFFMNGKVSIGSIANPQFYNNPIFPDIYTSAPAIITAKEIKTPSYKDLKNYVESNDWSYANVYICPAVNKTISDSANTNMESGGIVTYEFDTYNNKHVKVDESCIDQQINMDQSENYEDANFEQVAPGLDVAYLSDGERYYIEDYSRNLLTITIPME